MAARRASHRTPLPLASVPACGRADVITIMLARATAHRDRHLRSADAAPNKTRENPAGAVRTFSSGSFRGGLQQTLRLVPLRGSTMAACSPGVITVVLPHQPDVDPVREHAPQRVFAEGSSSMHLLLRSDRKPILSEQTQGRLFAERKLPDIQPRRCRWARVWRR